MEGKRGMMSRGQFGVGCVALAAGVVLSAGSASAMTGYLMGDPAPGKLVPFYQAKSSVTTIIGIESVEEDRLGRGDDPLGEDVLVHVTIFTKGSRHVTDFDLCLSPLDFGYIVLQQKPASAAQLADLQHATGPHTTRFDKARVYSVEGDGIPSEGYVTLSAAAEFESHDGTCAGILANDESPGKELSPGDDEPLATWAVLQDVGKGFFAAEIPTPTAIVADGSQLDSSDNPIPIGTALGGVGAYGLIPGQREKKDVTIPGNTVFARFDVNPAVKAKTDIFVWLKDGHSFAVNWPAFLDCEDEFELSTTIDLSNEVNIIDPDALGGIGQCKALGQYRGVLRFQMPDAGFLWSQVSQENEHFQETFLGYNLDCNRFVDPGCNGAN